MKKIVSCFAIGAFTSAMLLGVPAVRASGSPVSPAQEYQQEPWANPPSEWQEVQRKGFHDGIEGARKDAENHRPPNVNNRDEYRHPDVRHEDRRVYREAFRRGYQVGVEHLMNPGGQPYPPPQAYGQEQENGQEQWSTPPSEWQEIQRRGYHDGIEGARKDAQNHRPPNVNNRDEYRHPNDVPQRDRRAYRQAFRQGYWTAARHLMGYYQGPYPRD